MNRNSKALLGLLLFNGLTAVAGGLALMTDGIPEQASWVRDTDFPSNYFPGVILMAIVGGSSLTAAIGMVKRSDGWQLTSLLAGTIMVCRDNHGVLDHRRGRVDPWIPLPAGHIPRDRGHGHMPDTGPRPIE